MGLFRIQPHARLHEWVADECGFFREEGLDYTFVPDFSAGSVSRLGTGSAHSGAFESFEQGRDCDVSSACHWVTNQAATVGYGRMYADAYSVCPSAIVVPADSSITRPEDLAHVGVGVGYHSGSHFSAVQALESVLAPDQITLEFIGRPADRLDAMLNGTVAAVNVFGVALYALETLGYRKVLDTTFMMGHEVSPDISTEDVHKFFRALRKAQAEIDLNPERYKHYHLKALAKSLHDRVDVRRFGPGERIIFLPYTADMFMRTQTWMHQHGFFDNRPQRTYAESIVSAL